MAKKKKRKLKIARLLLILLLLLLITLSIVFLIKLLTAKEEVKQFDSSELHINEIDYSEAKQFNLDLYSKEYLLIRLNDFKVLYSSLSSKTIYPASLTKVLTMDTILSMCEDTNETTSFSSEELDELLEENASLAGIEPNVDYTIEDVLYALVLPSGGDAAKALENYADSKGKNLVEEMNNKCLQLNLSNSHFTNTTGLHDDNLYTSLDDYSKIVIDALLNPKAKEILKTPVKEIRGGLLFKSTLISLIDRKDNVKVYGGKTGYTPEAGMNIVVLYEVNNRSYMLVLANAPGSPYVDGLRSAEDVNMIFDYLY